MAAADNGHVLQTYEWGAFKAAWGWEPLRLLFERHGQPVGACSLLLRRIGPVAIAYAPKGPVLDFHDRQVAAFALETIAAVARRQRALYVKIDPDLPADDTRAMELLRAHGFACSTEQIQRPNTMMLNIHGSEEDLLGRMKPKWRYNIRLAEKKGVDIVSGGPADFEDFYRVYRETGLRDNFIVRPFEYCRQEWQQFLDAGLAAFYLARFEGHTLAAIMPFALGKRAWYMFGASSNIHRNLMPNHLLQWTAMRWARERGCTEYDMWGAPDELLEDQPLWGVFLFKQGFGAQFTRWAGAHDRVLIPPLHTAWRYGVPAYMKLLRRMKGEKTDERQLVGA